MAGVEIRPSHVEQVKQAIAGSLDRGESHVRIYELARRVPVPAEKITVILDRMDSEPDTGVSRCGGGRFEIRPRDV
jgi:hypothetical protein